jgi:tRNA(fMet)-specific endonuclease VapC
VAYLLDTGALAEVLRSIPSPAFVRRLASVPSRDRWTSVITVSQILIAARRQRGTKLMQDVLRLVASVKVASFDLAAVQAFARLRETVAPTGDPDDVMIAAVALANDFTLVTHRAAEFARYTPLRVEDWTK